MNFWGWLCGSALNCHVMSPYHPMPVLNAPVMTQLLANVAGKAMKEGPSNSVPATKMREPEGFPGSRL